jgi:hypothetical protein
LRAVDDLSQDIYSLSCLGVSRKWHRFIKHKNLEFHELHLSLDQNDQLLYDLATARKVHDVVLKGVKGFKGDVELGLFERYKHHTEDQAISVLLVEFGEECSARQYLEQDMLLALLNDSLDKVIEVCDFLKILQEFYDRNLIHKIAFLLKGSPHQVYAI